jgi:hypothetical protein
MSMKCLLSKSIGRSWSAAIVLGVIAFHSVFAARAEAQGFLFPGTGYRSRTVTRSGPGWLWPGPIMMGPGLGFAPFAGHSIAATPIVTGQLVGYSPNAVSLGAQPTYYVVNSVGSGALRSFSPQGTFQLGSGPSSGGTLTLAQQPNGSLVLIFSGGTPTAEHGMQVLSVGLGNDSAKVNGVLQALKSKLETLIGKNLNTQDLEDLLMATAKSALAGTGFGFLADPLLDMFLKPLIDKIIGDRLPGTITTPNGTTPSGTTPSGTTPSGTTPTGGMSFTVSGTIVLTPASGVAVPNPVKNDTPANGGVKPDPGVVVAPVIDP